MRLYDPHLHKYINFNKEKEYILYDQLLLLSGEGTATYDFSKAERDFMDRFVSRMIEIHSDTESLVVTSAIPHLRFAYPKVFNASRRRLTHDSIKLGIALLRKEDGLLKRSIPVLILREAF